MLRWIWIIPIIILGFIVAPHITIIALIIYAAYVIGKKVAGRRHNTPRIARSSQESVVELGKKRKSIVHRIPPIINIPVRISKLYKVNVLENINAYMVSPDIPCLIVTKGLLTIGLAALIVRKLKPGGNGRKVNSLLEIPIPPKCQITYTLLWGDLYEQPKIVFIVKTFRVALKLNESLIHQVLEETLIKARMLYNSLKAHLGDVEVDFLKDEDLVETLREVIVYA